MTRQTKPKKYATVNATEVKLESQTMPMRVLEQAIAQANNLLKNSTASHVGSEMMVTLASPVRISLVIPAEDGNLVLNPEKMDQHEASMQDAQDKAQLLSAASIKAAEVGDQIIDAARNGVIEPRELHDMLRQSPDEDVSRFIAGQANQPRREVVFPQGVRAIGGNTAIPQEAITSQTFVLRNVHLNREKGKQDCMLVCSETPTELRMLILPTQEGYRLRLDEGWISLLLRHALAESTKFDLEVCVCETIRKGKRMLLPVRLPNPEVLFAALMSQLAYLQERAEIHSSTDIQESLQMSS